MRYLQHCSIVNNSFLFPIETKKMFLKLTISSFWLYFSFSIIWFCFCSHQDINVLLTLIMPHYFSFFVVYHQFLFHFIKKDQIIYYILYFIMFMIKYNIRYSMCYLSWFCISFKFLCKNILVICFSQIFKSSIFKVIVHVVFLETRQISTIYYQTAFILCQDFNKRNHNF